MDEDMAISIDRDDLLGLLAVRFGSIPPEIKNEIKQLQDQSTVERLILVAANVSRWDLFVAELHAGSSAFKIVGDIYDPIAKSVQP